MDFLVPVFILEYLPWGVRGILVAALMAAAMSSLDSALNSLSASTMRDFVEKKRDLPVKKTLLLSKVVTVIWGIIVTGFAFLVANISETILESINKIGSAFYGPILAAFLVGVLSKRGTTAGIFAGVLAGVSFNIYLWIDCPRIFWMWWNFFGLLVAVMVTFLVSLVTRAQTLDRAEIYTLSGSGFLQQEQLWSRGHVLLIGYFFVILAFMLLINYVAN